MKNSPSEEAANVSNKPNKTTAQNWRQQQQDKTENLRAYEAARSLKITNYRTEILSPIEDTSDKPKKTTENTKEQENMPENSPKSYKNDNSISNESHSVLIENTRRNENELSNQEYIPEKGRYIQPMVVMACILIGVTIVAIIIFLLESVYGARVDLRKEKRRPVKIKEIQLSTHPDLSCGGYLVQIEIIQNEKSCLTEKIDEFTRGKTLRWTLSNKKLGDCKDLDVHIAKEISFKMKTESTNDFCPEHFHLELDYGVTFLSGKMVHWHDNSDNEDSHEAKAMKLLSFI